MRFLKRLCSFVMLVKIELEMVCYLVGKQINKFKLDKKISYADSLFKK